MLWPLQEALKPFSWWCFPEGGRRFPVFSDFGPLLPSTMPRPCPGSSHIPFPHLKCERTTGAEAARKKEKGRKWSWRESRSALAVTTVLEKGVGRRRHPQAPALLHPTWGSHCGKLLCKEAAQFLLKGCVTQLCKPFPCEPAACLPLRLSPGTSPGAFFSPDLSATFACDSSVVSPLPTQEGSHSLLSGLAGS